MNLVKETSNSVQDIVVHFPSTDLKGRATFTDYVKVAVRIGIVVTFSAIVSVAFAFAGGHPLFAVLGVIALVALLTSEWKRSLTSKFDDAIRADALFRRQGYCALYVHPFMAEHGYELSGMNAQNLIDGETVTANTGQVMSLRDNILHVVG